MIEIENPMENDLPADNTREDQFLDSQQYLENPLMQIMQSDENYYNNVFEPFPSYISQPYMPSLDSSTHRGSLPNIYDTSIPKKGKDPANGIDRRYTEGSLPKFNKRQRKTKETQDDQRRQFLERNRVAALKCRQRKKQWLADLQDRVEYLATDNEHLQSQTTLLREEVIGLKTLLLAHKDCEVAQANGITVSVIQNVSSIMPSDRCPKKIHGV